MADTIQRPRLMKELNRILERKLALVLAPAGYGKSTLVADWLASVSVPSAWLSLDAGDNTLMGFLQYLVASIQTLHSEVGHELLALLHSPELPPARVLVASLIQDLAVIQQDFVLVLDDYHVIKQVAIHDFMDQLLQFAPPALHLIIISRMAPPLSVHRLRLDGQLVEIRIQDLRFTAEEVLIFMRRTWNESFDPELASLLWQKSEGWAAGLRMYSLTVRRARDIAATIEHMPSREIVLEFLYHEVFAHQPEPIQKRLLVTAVVERFSAALCDFLCEELCGPDEGMKPMNGHQFIAWLEDAGVFVVPLDDHREWYRYHHLFQELLRQQLMQTNGPEFATRVHSRASSWFAQQSLLGEAILHALHAGDVERAADIIEQNKDRLLDGDQWGVLEKWIGWLPEEVINRRKGLVLARMWFAQFQYDFPRAVQLLAQLETLLTPDETMDPTMAGEIAFFRGLPLFWRGNVAESAPFFQQAADLLPLSNVLPRATAELYLGVAWQLMGRSQEVASHFTSLLAQAQKNDVRKGRLVAVLFITYLIQGELTPAYRYVHYLQRMNHHLQNHFHSAWVQYALGVIHLLWNELDFAIEHLSQAVDHRYFLDSNAVVDSFAGLALAYQRQGRAELANQTADQLEAFVRGQHQTAGHWETWVHSLRVRLAILQGNAEKALRHSRMADFAADRWTPLFWLELPRLTQARSYIFLGTDTSLQRATVLLEAHLEEMRRLHNISQQIQILPLLAVAYQRRGQIDRAMRHLLEAVTLAEKGSIMHPFLEQGHELYWLLKALNESHLAQSLHEFIRQLLDAFPAQKYDARPYPASLPEPLTRREREVLELMARQFSNREIAETLFISETTVKRHVSNILGKLQARRRQDAVQKAYALGVLWD